MKDTTICFLIRDHQILLAMKKRGFGGGKWNGAGGKVEEGESVESAACREVEEEIGVTVQPQHLQSRGYIDFIHDDAPEWNQRVHVFFISEWDGEPVETDEMRPQWFNTNELPFDAMWIDDPHWLPLAIAGKTMAATFRFTEKGSVIQSMSNL